MNLYLFDEVTQFHGTEVQKSDGAHGAGDMCSDARVAGLLSIADEGPQGRCHPSHQPFIKSL